MHYAEIKMAESMFAVCGDSYKSHYVLRIFSKAGSSKDLRAKVHKTSVIKISKDPIKAQNML